MLIEYIGRKAKQTDNTAGTGTVWFGAGDVKEVPDEAAVKLLAYDTIYALAAPVQKPKDINVEQAAGQERPEPKHLADMNDAELLAFAAANSLKVDGRKKGARLLAAVQDAVSA